MIVNTFSHTSPTSDHLERYSSDKEMANWTWLQGAADIATITTSLASWRALVGLALAVIAWVVIDWRKVHDVLHLGTQINRLQHDQFVLSSAVFPDNYLRLGLAIRNRATRAIHAYVSIDSSCTLDGFSFSFYLV
jgi:hypothetical protein